MKNGLCFLLYLVYINISYAQIPQQKNPNALFSVIQNANYSALYNPAAALPFGNSRDFLPVSPSAGSLGIFGQIPVGNYTGTPEINIPLYEIKYKELSVPISLNYHASGIKPEIFPGPVGLGWGFQAGGVISRVVKGYPDNGDYPNDDIKKRLISYRDGKDWYDVSKLQNYLIHQTLCFTNNSDPDEYYFNINGQTGKFYIDRTDTFRIQSLQGHSFQIILHETTKPVTFKPLPQLRKKNQTNTHPYSNQITLYDLITGFTLIDDKGIKYEFGGTDQSIEFSRPGFNESVVAPESYIRPMSWFITSIESPNGYKINFEYEQQTTLSRTYFSDIALKQTAYTDPMEVNFYARSVEYVKSTLINGCYLTQINFPGGKIIIDNSRADGQLDYSYFSDYSHIPPEEFVRLQYYDDVCWADTEKILNGLAENGLYSHKVDALHVYNNQNEEIKKIEFIYPLPLERWNRMKLYGINIYGKNMSKSSYRFDYNWLTLPSYDSRQTDMYGYYNGKGQFSQVSADDFIPYMREHPNYLNELKTPDLYYAQAEILNQITYPAGGYTKFEYELHEYGSEYKTWPFKVVQNPSGNKPTAGLRIKSVRNFDKDNKLLTEKRFHYIHNYLKGGTASSGVLAYTPKFTETYKNKYLSKGISNSILYEFFRLSTNPIYPMCATRGNHVTYSEVTVEDVNNGFTVYNYKNYDNGYADKELLGFVSTPLYNDVNSGSTVDFKPQMEGISMGLERGQLIKESVYDKNKTLLKDIEYTYNDDPARFEENVRYLSYSPLPLNMAQPFYCVSAGLHYTYFPYLKEKKEIDYLDRPVSKTTRYFYDKKYRILKRVETDTSEKQTRQITYLYPHEKTGTPVHSQMVAKRMIDYPIEETTYHKESTNTLIRQYSQGLSPDRPDLILLKQTMQQTEFTEPRILTSYNRYDAAGNPAEADFLSEGKVCFIWSYNKTYPVAKIAGLSYEEIKNALTPNFIQELENKSIPTNAEIEQIRTRLADKDALITTYTYDPLLGASSVTQPDGTKLMYEYDGEGRLLNVKDTNGYTIEQHTYHYAE